MSMIARIVSGTLSLRLSLRLMVAERANTACKYSGKQHLLLPKTYSKQRETDSEGADTLPICSAGGRLSGFELGAGAASSPFSVSVHFCSRTSSMTHPRLLAYAA